MTFYTSAILANTGRAAAFLASMLLVSGCPSSKSGESEQTAAQETTEAQEQPVAPDGEQAKEQAKAEPAQAPQLLAAGTPAPDFTVQAHDGSTIQMSELRGKPVVLYFYPKDDTPGCTVEAQSFRDGKADFAQAGATVIGVSLDSIESHKQFAENHDLEFPLLADVEGEIAAKYGVDTEGGYARRVTFVIDPEGKIAEVFPEVDVQGHADEVLATVQAL